MVTWSWSFDHGQVAWSGFGTTGIGPWARCSYGGDGMASVITWLWHLAWHCADNVASGHGWHMETNLLAWGSGVAVGTTIA